MHLYCILEPIIQLFELGYFEESFRKFHVGLCRYFDISP